MMIFDYIIGNSDRNGGNYLTDENKKLWAIDHHLAFKKHIDVPDYISSEDLSKETADKIKALAESEDQKTPLRKLLLEILEEERVNGFFGRLTLFYESFITK